MGPENGFQSRRSDLNRWPADYESAALPLSYVGASQPAGRRAKSLLPALGGQCQEFQALRYHPKILTSRAGLLNGSLSAAFVPAVLRLWTVFFPVQTQFAGARSLWSVLQKKTACAARATALDKDIIHFQ
jgi:hypothetical protein